MNATLLLTIIQTILPIPFTIALGYLAAWRRHFDAHQAGILIRLVMLYALPLMVFTSVLNTPRQIVLSAGPLAALILFGMLGGYLLVFVLCRFGLGQRQGRAALVAFAISGPSVPFIGIPVLGKLFGSASALPVSVAVLAMNLVQLPLTLILMSHDQNRLLREDEQGDSHQTLQETLKELSGHLLHSCKEPVVWMPSLALVLVLAGGSMPVFLKGSFLLLGHATSGMALFATGVVLFSRKVRFSSTVGWIVVARNLMIPLIIFGIARFLHLPDLTMQKGVMTMAIPTASISVILAMRFHILEREIASVLFFGTLSAVFTMAGFIWLTHSG